MGQAAKGVLYDNMCNHGGGEGGGELLKGNAVARFHFPLCDLGGFGCTVPFSGQVSIIACGRMAMVKRHKHGVEKVIEGEEMGIILMHHFYAMQSRRACG